MNYLLMNKVDMVPGKGRVIDNLDRDYLDRSLYIIGPRAAMDVDTKDIIRFCAEILNDLPVVTMLTRVDWHNDLSNHPFMEVVLTDSHPRHSRNKQAYNTENNAFPLEDKKERF